MEAKGLELNRDDLHRLFENVINSKNEILAKCKIKFAENSKNFFRSFS